MEAEVFELAVAVSNRKRWKSSTIGFFFLPCGDETPAGQVCVGVCVMDTRFKARSYSCWLRTEQFWNWTPGPSMLCTAGSPVELSLVLNPLWC